MKIFNIKSSEKDNFLSSQSFWSSMNIPINYHNCEITNFDGWEKLEVDKIRKNSIYIFGDCGSGKTHLSIGFLKKYVIEGTTISPSDFGDYEVRTPNAMFITHWELDLLLKEFSEYRDNLKKIMQKDILLIDDLGGVDNKLVYEYLYPIIDFRYSNNLKTIINSNLTIQKLHSVYDDRIASRIVGAYQIIGTPSVDWRLKSIKEGNN